MAGALGPGAAAAVLEEGAVAVGFWIGRGGGTRGAGAGAAGIVDAALVAGGALFDDVQHAPPEQAAGAVAGLADQPAHEPVGQVHG